MTRYRKSYNRAPRKTMNIGGHTLSYMPSKPRRDGKVQQCCACGDPTNVGDNVSPYKPEAREPWMYGASIWAHSACVAKLLSGEHDSQAETFPLGVTVTQAEASQEASNQALAGGVSKVTNTPNTVTGRQVALKVMELTGIGKVNIPLWWEKVTLAPEQLAGVVKILTTETNVQILAGPGCGKSFFCQFFSWVAKTCGVYLVFNNAMKEEQVKAGKLYGDISISTNHGSGLAICRENIDGKVIIAGGRDDKKASDPKVKVRTILWDLIPVDRYASKDVKATIRRKRRLAHELVGHYKSQLKSLASDGPGLVSRFNISTTGMEQRDVNDVFNVMPDILAECERQGRAGYLDFNDMIWLPLVAGWKPRSKSWVFIDEAQDLSPAQLKLALSVAGDTGRTIMVGDPKQAIYAWRGAALNGMDDAYQTLKAHPRGCVRHELMGTFRTPRSGVALCNLLYPQAKTKLSTHVDRDGYIVRVAHDSDWLDTLNGMGLANFMLILCRTNAPLVGGALTCIKNGIKAVIRGRDLSGQLIELIKLVNAKNNNDVSQLLAALDLHVNLEAKRAAEKGTTIPQGVTDKVDCLRALAEGCEFIGKPSQPATLRGKMAAIFNDDSTDAITFSTIHQAKGLEANYIVILKPELMPGPWAETADQMEEEKHIQWVAYSRHKHAIIFVDGAPSCGLPPGKAWDELPDALAGDTISDFSRVRKQKEAKREAKAKEVVEDPNLKTKTADGRAHWNNGLTKVESETVNCDSCKLSFHAPNNDVSNVTCKCPRCGETDNLWPHSRTTDDAWEAVHKAREEAANISTKQSLTCYGCGLDYDGCLCGDTDFEAPNGNTVKRANASGWEPTATVYRFSTTLDVRGYTRDIGKNGVDICRVTSPDGRNTGGVKRTNRTGGWRDRIILKFSELSGVNIPTFGDKRSRGAVAVTQADWDAIRDAINATGKANAYYHVPKGWKMQALIVEVQ